ncbi:hypothetical protein P4K96_14640, partial [Bacillus cereus]|nr:hypothetical protein [Bacillus cereus]
MRCDECGGGRDGGGTSGGRGGGSESCICQSVEKVYVNYPFTALIWYNVLIIIHGKRGVCMLYTNDPNPQ